MSEKERVNLFHLIISRCMGTLICSLFLTTIPQFVFAHGTVTSPPSRIWNCYQENPESPNSAPCRAAVESHGTQALNDWNEINQGNANDQHMNVVPNGNLASGGRPDKYGGMDQARTDWVATSVSPGAFTVTWTISASHASAYFDVYITNEDWTPDQPLTWESLTLLIQTDPSPVANVVDIPITLPNRRGKHVIYSVWQRSDSPEAFYSTSDVDFGVTTSISDIEESQFLKSSYPNPFSQTNRVEYNLSKGENVTLKVYDIYGRAVSTLVDGFQASGEYVVIFNGENLRNGIYLYVFEIGDFRETKQIVLQH